MEAAELFVMQFDVENTLDWRFRVLVSGAGFPTRSMTLFARLGDQELQGVTVTDDGNGFSGYLLQRPEPGDRLFVTSSGLEEIDTGLTFAPVLEA